MAQTLRLKRSSVPGRVPTTATLKTGEIAINTADGLVYIRKDDDTIIPLLGLNNSTNGDINLTGSVIVLGSIEATSFEGAFTGSFSGSIDSPLSGIISGGTQGGFEEFTYDGRTSVTLTIDTGSAHFRDAVNEIASGSRALISVFNTAGAGGIELSYNSDTGRLSGSLVNPSLTLGGTEVQLGQTVTSLDNVTLTNAAITGSVLGTASSASFATSALTASYALNVDPVDTGSLLANATAQNAKLTFTRGDSTSFDVDINNVASASFATYADLGRFASLANIAFTASSADNFKVRGDLEVDGVLVATASYALAAATSSYTTTAITAQTASSADNFDVRGDLTVQGIVTAQEFHTEFVSASIIYQSGSTKFGDTLDDTHQFTGSVDITGSVTVGDVNINDWGSVSSSLAELSSSIQASANPTLQDVTDNGSLTTNHISISSSLNVSQSIISKGEDVLDFAVAMAIALG